VQGVQVSAPFGRYDVAAEVIASVLPPEPKSCGVEAMPSFEESLKKLETIVDQLEKGDLALEESLKLFEEGVALSAACKQELDAAEGKVQMLVKQRDGSLKPEAAVGSIPREDAGCRTSSAYCACSDDQCASRNCQRPPRNSATPVK
jgi:exodeoxyribonuclease VII small subunit